MSLLATIKHRYHTSVPLETRQRVRGLRMRFSRLEELAYRVLRFDLATLATLFNTDKWGAHWYAQHYERHFAPRRRKPLVLLEIGIGGYAVPTYGGESLRMWRTYFPRARIYGIDIYDKSAHDERRIKTFRGSQTDPEFLRAVIDQIGSPDIIIDDGSHVNEHILTTFAILFPLLSANGIYVIEDTQTAYWPELGGSSADLQRADTSMGLVKRLIDGLNHREFLIDGYVPSYADEHVVAVHCYHSLVVIQKGINDEVSVRRATKGEADSASGKR